MRVSSGTVSLFSSVAFALGGAGAVAYALKNPADANAIVRKIFAVPDNESLWSRKVASPLPASAETESDTRPRHDTGDVSLRATSNGHFQSDAEVNGRSIDVLVDTGATLVALTYEDAERAGIYLRPADFTHSVSTANGIAKVAPVTISSISIGSITVRNVQAAVCERGKLQQTLLGMSFLSRLSRVDMRAGILVLQD
ncbi:MAG: TIGR02281 family clan AA aspartic protease [Hyphomicrobium sp.]|nr:TIGR02281 family clan AA aspartic protease [Hyphomicrobium sp.]